MSDRPEIERALDAIADGGAHDWRRAVASARDPSTRGTLQALSVLARVQELTNSSPGSRERWGSLELVETIGAGSYGTVFRARDPALDLDVALKVLHDDAPAARQRILDEGRWLAKLRHPNIVRVYGVDERDGRVGLRMELVRGRTLDTIVRESGTFGPVDAVRIGVDLCRALAAVHAAELVHRDIKAQNVIRETSGRIVLMDFGAGSETQERTGRTLHLAGTPLYIAPELLAGAKPTPAADLYSLGVLLYFLMTGRFPVEADSLSGVRAAHQSGRQVPLADRRPDVPAPIAAIVETALSRSALARPSSAETMARALASALLDETDETTRKRSGSFPLQLTRFVGGRGPLEAVNALLRQHRLVTLTGPGGVGKTRLALETADVLGESFDGGTWFVPLGRAHADSDVAAVFANALGVRARENETPIASIERLLSDRRCLVVADNAEHVLNALTAFAVELLRRLPGVTLLVTSREPLNVPGERLHDVLPLETPETRPAAEPVADALGAVAAVRLFVERAGAVRSDFVLDRTNAPEIAEICRRLDGLPLALELAAAHVRTLSLAEIVRRLDDRFALLDRSGAAEPTHHETLEASIAWSHDLLQTDERRTLASLATFAHGWTLAAAEHVVPRATGINGARVLDILSGLVNKSLVRLDGTSRARYSMLESVAAFAATRADAEESRRYTETFFEWCLDTAAETHLDLIGSGAREAMVRFAEEHDNFVAACRVGLELGRVEDTLRLGSFMGRFWLTSTRWSEGRHVLESLLAHPDARKRTLMRAAALGWLGVFAQSQRRRADARALHEECLSIREEQADTRGVAAALNQLGVMSYDDADYDDARSAFTRSLALRREADERRGIAQSLTNLALCDLAEERLEDARKGLEAALAVHRELANEWGIAKIRAELAFLTALEGDTGTARADVAAAIESHEQMGSTTVLRCYMGFIELLAGATQSARAAFEQAIDEHRATGESGLPAEALRGLAFVASADGDHERAARGLGRAAAFRRSALNRRAARETADVEARARRALGDEAFDRAYADGLDAPEEA